MGRTRTGPGHRVYGGHRGDTVQPGNQDVLSALVWSGQSQEGGARRLHAETADYAQRHAQASDALANGSASARLTVKTVADPNYLLQLRCFAVSVSRNSLNSSDVFIDLVISVLH